MLFKDGEERRARSVINDLLAVAHSGSMLDQEELAYAAGLMGLSPTNLAANIALSLDKLVNHYEGLHKEFQRIDQKNAQTIQNLRPAFDATDCTFQIGDEKMSWQLVVDQDEYQGAANQAVRQAIYVLVLEAGKPIDGYVGDYIDTCNIRYSRISFQKPLLDQIQQEIGEPLHLLNEYEVLGHVWARLLLIMQAHFDDSIINSLHEEIVRYTSIFNENGPTSDGENWKDLVATKIGSGDWHAVMHAVCIVSIISSQNIAVGKYGVLVSPDLSSLLSDLGPV